MEVAKGVRDCSGDVAGEDGEGVDTVAVEVTIDVIPFTAVGVSGPSGQNVGVS